MKTKFLTLIALLTTSLLSGCGSGQDNKIIITYGDKTLDSYIVLTTEQDLITMIDREDNFILVSYADPRCSCWGTFEESVIKPYVRDYDIPIYVIETNALSDDDFYGLPINSDKSNTPVLGLYENGKYKVGANYFSNPLIFQKINDFINYLNRYISKPYGYYVDFDQVDALLKGKDKFILNWSWKLCPDCAEFDRRFLKSYIEDNPSEKQLPIYVVDTHVVRNGDQEVWQEIKDTYGLSQARNKDYGYSSGYVPSLQIIEPDATDYVSNGDISPIIKDMFVYRNEKFSIDGSTYTITDSYFDGTRATNYLGAYESEIGQTFTLSSNQTRNEVRDPIHDRYATKFLDYYWK